MDSGLTVRPTGAAQSASARADAAPVRGAVPTNLDPAQSVTALSRSSEVRTQDTSHVRKIILDAQSREVIYQGLDARPGRVIRQIREDATLRLRAYVRAIANGATPNRGQAQLDLDVEA